MRYGPLSNSGRISLHNFNLFFGKNEEGKTLTIDALVKLLLGRNIRGFPKDIDRVEENPEGYVIIEDDKGEEIKLPEKGNLIKIVDLAPSECRNIFVIRNSDLSIACEGEFYTNVTDKLTGLRTDEISQIKESLKEIGKITPSGIFRDIKDEKLKTRIENAEDLSAKIENLAREVREEGFDELEEKSARCREEIDRIKLEIENLDDARKRKKYEKGKEALDKLKDTLEKFKDLEIYNEDAKQLWRDCEKDIQTYNKEKGMLFTDLKTNEKELKETEEKLREGEKGFRVFDERKRKLDDQVKPELKNYEIKSGELAKQERKSKFFTSVGMLFGIFLGICLLGIIFNPSLLFFILVGLFSISTVVLWIFKYKLVRGRAWLAGAFEKLKLTLSRFELSAESIEGILSNVQRFGEEYAKKVKELEEIRGDKRVLESDIEKLRERVLRIEKKIRDAEDKIDGLRRESREESLQEYTKKLELKQRHERSIGEQKSILENFFGAEIKTLEANISYWDGEVRDLKDFKDKAKDIEYDEKLFQKLKGEEKSYEGKLNELEGKMSHFRKDLEEIEREANKILQLETEYLHCQTSVDLNAIREELQEFINENKSNKDNVLRVMKIFEEIETEEKGRVSELFGKDSSVSKYFNGITGGLYKEVLFNQKKGKIEIRRTDEVILEAEKLSGGAYDQLYLSIRLALGERLLKGKEGFFIMDDPFVKADPDRLQRQIKTLKKISELGWQIMYFSAKGEIRDAFKEDIKNGFINPVKIQGILP